MAVHTEKNAISMSSTLRHQSAAHTTPNPADVNFMFMQRSVWTRKLCNLLKMNFKNITNSF